MLSHARRYRRYAFAHTFTVCRADVAFIKPNAVVRSEYSGTARRSRAAGRTVCFGEPAVSPFNIYFATPIAGRRSAALNSKPEFRENIAVRARLYSFSEEWLSYLLSIVILHSGCEGVKHLH